MSKGGDQEVVQTTAPWGPQVPYLIGGRNNTGQQVPGLFPLAAQWLQGGGPSFFPNSTVAPLAPQTNAAIAGITDRAVGGSPLEAAAQGYATDVLTGGAGNDFLSGVFDDISSRVIPAVQSQFTASGRTGSPLEAINLTNELTRAYSPFAFGAAENAENRRMSALGMAPELAGLDYRNMAQLLNAGSIVQNQGQAELQDAINRWNFEQNQPLSMLQQYQGLVQGNYGGSMTQPSYSNPGAGLLGGAATGAGIASALGATGPWGWAAAGLGGLLGLLQ